MPSRWIEFVKDWASKNGISYGCALSNSTMVAEYHKKYNTPKHQERERSRDTFRESVERGSMENEDINRVSKKNKQMLLAELTKLQKEYPQIGYDYSYDRNEFNKKVKDLFVDYGYDFGKVLKEEQLYWTWEIDNKVEDSIDDTAGKRYFPPASFSKPVNRRTNRLPVEFVIKKYLPLTNFTDKQIGSLLYNKKDPFSLLAGMNNAPFIQLAVYKEVIDKNYGNINKSTKWIRN